MAHTCKDVLVVINWIVHDWLCHCYYLVFMNAHFTDRCTIDACNKNTWTISVFKKRNLNFQNRLQLPARAYIFHWMWHLLHSTHHGRYRCLALCIITTKCCLVWDSILAPPCGDNEFPIAILPVSITLTHDRGNTMLFSKLILFKMLANPIKMEFEIQCAQSPHTRQTLQLLRQIMAALRQKWRYRGGNSTTACWRVFQIPASLP